MSILLAQVLAQNGTPPGNVIFAWVLYFLVGEMLPLVLLVCCWSMGDQTVRTKLILTLLYVAHFGLVLLPALSPALVPWTFGLYGGAKLVLVAVIGVTTFGWEWLTRRR
jgi:hypothetical protein